jgi:acetoin utilization deacetylase AcuC-like enzyme
VDWDLHHGNGTQHVFEADPSILYFSTHQSPYYPGTGNFNEVGHENGRGYTVNVPLRAGCGDEEFAKVFERILKPVAAEFKPELVLVSAGFDCHDDDPLGGMHISSKGFGVLTRMVMDVAEQSCQGRLVLTLEGGYNIQRQKEAVKNVLQELSGQNHSDAADLLRSADPPWLEAILRQVKAQQQLFWKNL